MPTVNENLAKFIYFILKYILRNKNVTLKMVKAGLLLNDLEEKMISDDFFPRPRYDIEIEFTKDIKTTISNASRYLAHEQFTFEGWMMWVGDIHLHSFTTHSELINQYANAILLVLFDHEELQKLHNHLQSDTSIYIQRIIALHLSFRDNEWSADIKKVAKTTVSYTKEAIVKYLSNS